MKSLLDYKGLIDSFMIDEGAWEDSNLPFYERNPIERGLDFNETPEEHNV